MLSTWPSTASSWSRPTATRRARPDICTSSSTGRRRCLGESPWHRELRVAPTAGHDDAAAGGLVKVGPPAVRCPEATCRRLDPRGVDRRCGLGLRWSHPPDLLTDAGRRPQDDLSLTGFPGEDGPVPKHAVEGDQRTPRGVRRLLGIGFTLLAFTITSRTATAPRRWVAIDYRSRCVGAATDGGAECVQAHPSHLQPDQPLTITRRQMFEHVATRRILLAPNTIDLQVKGPSPRVRRGPQHNARWLRWVSVKSLNSTRGSPSAWRDPCDWRAASPAP